MITYMVYLDMSALIKVGKELLFIALQIAYYCWSVEPP